MQTPKYNLHRTVYTFNLMAPLVVEFEIIGIVDKGEEGIYYSCNLNNWVREDYLYESGIVAYAALLSQAKQEMDNLMIHIKKNLESSREIKHTELNQIDE